MIKIYVFTGIFERILSVKKYVLFHFCKIGKKCIYFTFLYLEMVISENSFFEKKYIENKQENY